MQVQKVVRNATLDRSRNSLQTTNVELEILCKGVLPHQLLAIGTANKQSLKNIKHAKDTQK